MWIRLIFGLRGCSSDVGRGRLPITVWEAISTPGTTIEVEGEITGIHWRNPHVKFTMMVTGEGGEQRSSGKSRPIR